MSPARRLLWLVRPEAGVLAVATLFLLSGSLVGLLLPQALRGLITSLGVSSARLPAERLAQLHHAAGLLLLAVAAQGALNYLRGVLFTTAGERVVTRLRRGLYAALLRKELGFFDQVRSSEMVSRLSADTAVVQQALTLNLSYGLRHLLTALGSAGFMLYMSARLTLLLLVLLPVLAGLAALHGGFLRRLSQRVQDALAHSSAVAEEALAGIRTVRLFAQEDAEERRYARAVAGLSALVHRRARIGGAFQALAGIIGYGAVVLVLWYGGAQVLRGALSAAELTAFLLYAVLLCTSLAGLDDVWGELMRAAGASRRLFDWMGEQLEEQVGAGAEGAAPVRGALRFEGVRFRYPARPDVAVLEGLHLELRPGEVVALLGRSGSGKSTIAALLSRLYDPEGGRVLLDGRDLRALDPRWLRRQVGVVAQEALLFSSSIADNIAYGRPDASPAEIEAVARAANVHDFIAALPQGYRTLVGERGVCLSGGQRQRIAIARALLQDPRVLILDEATSALDQENERLVQEALERLMRGRTTLIIAHRLSTVRGAERVLVLEGGRIVEEGTHAALAAGGARYQRLLAQL